MTKPTDYPPAMLAHWADRQESLAELDEQAAKLWTAGAHREGAFLDARWAVGMADDLEDIANLRRSIAKRLRDQAERMLHTAFTAEH